MALGRCELTLTAKSLCFVNWDSVDEAFDFVFGDKACRVHSVLAEFLSQKVSRQRRCDPLCDVYTFSRNNSDLLPVFEQLVSSLRSGAPFEINGSNFGSLFRLSQELENSELLSSLVGIIQSGSLSFEDAIIILRAGVDIGSAFSDRLRDIRNGVASRFYDMKKEILEELDIETLQLLLSSPSLKINDEDSLYDLVRSRSESDVRFASLFEFVQFEYLSVNRIEDFASFAQEHLLENITSGIWTRVCGRLIQETKHGKNPRGSTARQSEFVCDPSKPLDGIIAHLTRQCGGNVHDKRIVKVTASNFPDNSVHPKNVVDLGTDSEYRSNDDQAWICYDFGERSVIPTSYSLRSGSQYYLRSWVIEVSKDGTENSWSGIDHRDNNDLNSVHCTRTFTLCDIPSESFRFVRIRMTNSGYLNTGTGFGGTWGSNRYPLALSSFELFGRLC